MVLSTVYILVGMTVFTTIIEIVRYLEEYLKDHVTDKGYSGGSMRRAGRRCRS
jgi:hypothetical protein